MSVTHHHTTTVLRPFFRDHLGEPVPEENFWTLWCKGRLTEADIVHPAGRHSIRTNQCLPPPSPHIFYRPDALPCRPANSIKALKADIIIMSVNGLKYSVHVNMSTFAICTHK